MNTTASLFTLQNMLSVTYYVIACLSSLNFRFSNKYIHSFLGECVVNLIRLFFFTHRYQIINLAEKHAFSFNYRRSFINSFFKESFLMYYYSVCQHVKTKEKTFPIFGISSTYTPPPTTTSATLILTSSYSQDYDELKRTHYHTVSFHLTFFFFI
jgi:hypothetical protein